MLPDSTMPLQEATCARLPSQALTCLAGLRRSEGISVVLDGEHAWVSWDQGDEWALRAILPVAGVELFERRGGAWHRAGRRMPAFEGPPGGEAMPIARAVTPAPFTAMSPRECASPTVRLRLRRDDRPRPTTAALCPLRQLECWADSAPSSQIGAIRGAVRGDSSLLLGRGLPPWHGATRYWGGQLLVPIGFEVRPSLPEATIVEALGHPGREIFRIIPDDGDGDVDDLGLEIEAIPMEAFVPLSRAGVRLALVGTPPP